MGRTSKGNLLNKDDTDVSWSQSNNVKRIEETHTASPCPSMCANIKGLRQISAMGAQKWVRWSFFFFQPLQIFIIWKESQLAQRQLARAHPQFIRRHDWSRGAISPQKAMLIRQLPSTYTSALFICSIKTQLGAKWGAFLLNGTRSPI